VSRGKVNIATSIITSKPANRKEFFYLKKDKHSTPPFLKVALFWWRFLVNVQVRKISSEVKQL